jgi:hypothetical protein
MAPVRRRASDFVGLADVGGCVLCVCVCVCVCVCDIMDVQYSTVMQRHCVLSPATFGPVLALARTAAERRCGRARASGKMNFFNQARGMKRQRFK